MLSKTRSLWLISVLLYCSWSAKGQSNPYKEVSIASPTAASLGKYADIPVNYHTGIPEIGIPIYTVKEGTLSLPISLSYHASGLKVMEMASWVGAGWALNAGGVITRSVQGAPDERGTSTVTNQTHGFLSDSGFNKYYFVDDLPGSKALYHSPIWSIGDTLNDWDRFASGQKDGEPDLFFFNFNGYSGKFVIGDDGAPMMIPRQDFKIQYQYTSGVGQSISSFQITTPDGTNYYFGRTPSPSDVDPVEITNPMNNDVGSTAGTVVSSWFLNKVVSSDGVFQITLTYLAETYSYYGVSLFPLFITNSTGQNEYKLIRNIVNGVRLSRIQFSSGYVDFLANNLRQDLNGPAMTFQEDANTSARTLDAINITDGASNCKQFSFAYDYFTDNTTALPGYLSLYSYNADRKRLKLLSLQEKSCDGSIAIPPHLFTYFSEAVPRRLSFAQDHWGYNNGVTSNSTMIPTYTENYTTMPGANRDPVWPAMRAGTISRITYPTGGFTDFVFEPHYTWTSFNYQQWVMAQNFSAGYDGSNSPVTKYYRFTTFPVQLRFSNSSQGAQAILNIYDSLTNQLIKTWIINPSQTLTETLNLTTIPYKVVLQKMSATSGNGAMAYFDQWTSFLQQGNAMVGGLRIKTLTHNDGIATQDTIVTNYTYESSLHSTGVLYGRPAYVQSFRNDIRSDAGSLMGDTICPFPVTNTGCIICSGDGSPINTYWKSPVTIRPLNSTQGSHIGYKEVKVSQVGHGYSIFRYNSSSVWDSNTDDVAYRSIKTNYCDNTIPGSPSIPPANDYSRGELSYEAVYNESGQILKETLITPTYVEDSVYIPAFVCQTTPFRPASGSTPGSEGAFYDVKTAKKTMVQVIEKTYQPGGAFLQKVNTTYFGSRYHNMASRSTSVSSEGDTIETRMTYAMDLVPVTCGTIADGWTQYKNDINYATTIYQLRRYDLTNTDPFINCSTGQNCKFWAWMTYTRDKALARIKYIRARTSAMLSANSSYNTCFNSARNSADATLKPVYDMQLNYLNPVLETSSWKAGKLLAAELVNYNYALNPITAVVPSVVKKVNLTSPSVSFTPVAISGNTIASDSRYQNETTIKFSSGRIVEILPKNGVSQAYLWDNTNNFPIARALPATYSALSAAYASSGNNLNTLRNQATLSVSQVTTFTYDPLIGMTGELDLNGRKTSYIYDKLFRLSLVRDKDSNIVKQICYGYNGQTGDCNTFYNDADSGSFTRSCPINYTSTSVIYRVPAGRYSSTVSKAAANQLAHNDVVANGPAYATANAVCIAPPVNVQGYNAKTQNYQLRLVSIETGTNYLFTLTKNTTTFSVLGQVPAGNYNVSFFPMGTTVTATFVVNGFTQTGTTASFSNISITATTSAYMY